MEVRERRRRMTLSDQLSAPAAVELPSSASKLTTSSSSTNLGDLLKVRQEEDLQRPPLRAARGRRSASIALGTFLACEKRELAFPGIAAAAAAAAAAAIGSRTLLDIIRDEDESNGGDGVYNGVLVGGDGGHKISWRRAFRERLRIRRAGNPTDGVTLAFPAAASPSRSPAPQNNPARAIAGDATPPAAPRTAATDLPNAAASGGEQPEGSSRGGLTATGTNGETQQQQQPPQQLRVSLMALLDETDRHGGGPGFAVSALLEGVGEEEEEEEEQDGKGGRHYVKCCVCMVRHKGAAFIPCGHTFCRLCCRELWVSRGSCPLCNGFILEVLDIF